MITVVVASFMCLYLHRNMFDASLDCVIFIGASCSW